MTGSMIWIAVAQPAVFPTTISGTYRARLAHDFHPVISGLWCCSDPLTKDFGWLTNRPVSRKIDLIGQRLNQLVNEAYENVEKQRMLGKKIRKIFSIPTLVDCVLACRFGVIGFKKEHTEDGGPNEFAKPNT